jgi:hypothetical protein
LTLDPLDSPTPSVSPSTTLTPLPPSQTPTLEFNLKRRYTRV